MKVYHNLMIAAMALLTCSASAIAADWKDNIKFYGFIRNYMAYDSRESLAGTGDLFYYLPKDRNLNEMGEDLNQKNQFRFLSITSRLGVDVLGYQWGKTTFGGKIEADFYAGLSGVTGTATFRLRQAYLTAAWKDLPMGSSAASVNLKIGQAWHPMAADLCPVFTLESGVPFGPFNRSPQITLDANLGDHFTLTASALWQMQYTSTGPDGASANYIKYSCTPEGYLGLTYKTGGFLARIGADVLSIKPRTSGPSYRKNNTEDVAAPKIDTVQVKVSDRITTLSPFVYMQYVKGGFEFKAKTIYASAGEHMNIQGGYGITKKYTGEGEDGHYEYAPIHTSSSWATVAYTFKKIWKPMIMAGYYKNFGTTEDLVNTDGKVLESDFYFAKNSYRNLNQLYRISPSLVCTLGRFSIGLNYEFSGAQYGKPGTVTVGKQKVNVYDVHGLALEGLHWVYNHRVQAMFKFSF